MRRVARAVVWLFVAASLLCGVPRAGAAGSVTIGMQLEPPSLDPTANPAAAIAEALYGNVYEGLVEFAPDGRVVPRLAASWDVAPDGREYTFHLRPGVSFHDGSSFDAGSAAFSLGRALAPDSRNPQRARVAVIERVETPDALTLRLVLRHRSVRLLESLAWASFVMVSPRSAAANGAAPVGTGPFRFVEWRRGDSLTLERNADYWGARPPLDRATFRFIADPTAAYAALMAGDIDAFDNYPAPESFAQFARDPRFAVFVGPTEGETVLALNNRRPPFDALEVRRAIGHALDRRAIIDGAMFGYGTPIGSHFPPRNPAYLDLTDRYPYDPAEARRLLAAAGYPNGFAVTLELPPPSYARRSGEIIAAELAAVGIRVSTVNLEWAQWLDQVYARHEFDMSIVVHAEPMDYDIYARDDYYFGYSNPAFKSLIAALDASVDPDERRDLLHRVQRRLADDAVNGFLFQYPKLAVWNAKFTGLGFDNVLGVVDLGHARFTGVLAEGSAARAQRWTLVAARWLCAAGMLALLLVAVRSRGAAFVAGRFAALLATLVAATVIVFVVVQVVPGDPVRTMLGMQADPQTIAVLRIQLGLDAAPWRRYVQWVLGLVRGDFGSSYTYGVPVSRLIAERLQVSVPLAVLALLLSSLIALPAGLLAAFRRGRSLDWLITGLTQLGLAVPNFWLGILLVSAFAVHWHWVAAGGFPGWEGGAGPALRALVLPAIALATPQAAILTRVLRGALLDTLHEDYIRTARAKGVGDFRVLWRHSLPNALVPVLTILGMQFSFLLAGAIIIENVFFLPGLGRLVFQAIAQRDLIVVQSVVVLLVISVVSVSFAVDLGYGLIDRRLTRVRAA